MVKLMNFVTKGKTNFDHFCCREDDVLAVMMGSTETSLLRSSPFSNALLYHFFSAYYCRPLVELSRT
jgi:hypothetical protein